MGPIRYEIYVVVDIYRSKAFCMPNSGLCNILVRDSAESPTTHYLNPSSCRTKCTVM